MKAIAILVGLAVTFGAAEYPQKPTPPQRDIDLGSVPSGMPSKFSATEGVVLKKIGATPEQIKRMEAHGEERSQRFRAIREDYQRDNDTARLLGRQLEVMKWSRTQTKAILGEEKYAAYQKHWDEVMKPALDNGKRNPNASIQIIDRNGKPTGFQLKPLTSPEDKERFEKQLEEALKKRQAEKKSSPPPGGAR